MLAQAASFLASSAGGALLGFVMDWVAEKRERERERDANDLERDRILTGRQMEHAKQLDAAAVGQVHPRRTKLKFFGFEYEKTTYKTNYPPRTLVVAYSLFVLVTTYCAIILLWAGNPAEVIWSIAPDAVPTKWGIPWLFMVEHSNVREPVGQNAGGVVFLMLHSLNFLINTAVVGVSRNALRRR